MRRINKNPKRAGILLFPVLIFLLAAAAVSALSVGSADIGILKSIRILSAGLLGIPDSSLADVTSMQCYIVMKVRLPRVIVSVLVGAGLSLTGAVFQGLFRNPLADPHILGVSSGAAMGATIAILSGASVGMLGLGSIQLMAFAGALLSVILVFAVSRGSQRGNSILTVLLTGTAVSTMLSAVISLLMSLNLDNAEKIYLWTMGSFSASSSSKAAWLAVIFVICSLVLYSYAKDLNLMVMGEETAKSLGVETGKVRTGIILAGSLLTAASVSSSGMIGFVGLVVPHCMRFFAGDDHRRLLPASALGGGIFLLFCDTIARTILAPGELPVGVVTALIGAPYFIFLIRKNR